MLDMINISPLHVKMKLEAVREVALEKIQHLLANMNIPQKVLTKVHLSGEKVAMLKSTHTTQDVVLHESNRCLFRCPEY